MLSEYEALLVEEIMSEIKQLIKSHVELYNSDDKNKSDHYASVANKSWNRIKELGKRLSGK